MSMLTMENIYKEFRNRTVLNGASLRVERGERLALTGPNGSGKTTLIRIAMGLEVCDSGNVAIARGIRPGYLTQELEAIDFLGQQSCQAGVVPGETAVHYEKVARLERKLRELERQMELAAGDNSGGGYSGILAEYSRLQERYESLDGYTVEARIKSTLLGLGLKEEALSIPVESLSGGERMRVAIARLLLEQPDLLILDEPTNHLDIHAVEWLEEFLRRFDGGVLFVSHDRYFLDRVATRVAELENGTIIERSGSYTSFVEQKEKMREFALKEQKRLELEIEIAEKKALSLKGEGSHRTRNISAWKSREKMVARLKDELKSNNTVFKKQGHLFKTSAPHIAFKGVRHISSEIAGAEGLKKAFGDAVLFSDVSFLIRGGERVGIIGDNGCGKTTLLRILTGADTGYEGFARLGSWVRYAWLGQDITFQDEGRTILEEFISRKELRDVDARKLLAGFQFFGDDLDKKLGVLSGGERVRLYLACIMLDDPDCLIMDEPTNHLDVAARNAVETALKNFKGTIIAVSHDRYFLSRCINRIFEFKNGRLNCYEGNYESYRRFKQSEEGSVSGCDAASRRQRQEKEAGALLTGTQPKAELSRQKVETDIFRLEDRKRELEGPFSKETPSSAYVEYNDVIRQLNDLYGLWELQE